MTVISVKIFFWRSLTSLSCLLLEILIVKFLVDSTFLSRCAFYLLSIKATMKAMTAPITSEPRKTRQKLPMPMPTSSVKERSPYPE